MHFDLISLFPEQMQSMARLGVIGRALDRGQVSLRCWNPRDYTDDAYRRVDERPFGGGPGMVMLVEPLRRTLDAIRANADGVTAPVIHFSPRGRPLTQARVRALAALPRLVLIASRYEGVDQRFLDQHVHEEISIGDYVLAGGELPALVLLEAVSRLQEGVLHTAESAEQDSFGDSGLLDCPHYTRPEHLPEGSVPPVLLSGDHAAIARWRLQQQWLETKARRPELLDRLNLSDEQKKLLSRAGFTL